MENIIIIGPAPQALRQRYMRRVQDSSPSCCRKAWVRWKKPSELRTFTASSP